jgi:ComEC/Rec2-related protein
MTPLLLTVVLLNGLVWWRVGEWREQERDIISGRITHMRLQLSRPVAETEYGCTVEWRGWRLYFSQALCNSGRLTILAAGTILDQEYAYDGDPVFKKLQAREVALVTTRPPSVLSLPWWQQRAWDLRERLVLLLQRVLQDKEAALVVGILLGVKSTLSSGFAEALIKTGTMHVVAASGYNISVVASMMMRLLLGFFSRRIAAMLSFLAVWMYVLMSGADPPIVRAGLMGSLILFSWITGRELWVMFGYLLSGVLLLLVSPWLASSVSFQLSMAATAGVIWGTAWINRMLKFVSVRAAQHWLLDQVWQNLLTTIAATAAVLPILMIHFGEVSWLGLAVNPVVLGLVPMIMYLGLLVSISGFIWFPAAQLLGWLTLPIARIWIMTVMGAGKFSGGTVSFPVNWWWAWGWWAAWLGMILFSFKQWKRS